MENGLSRKLEEDLLSFVLGGKALFTLRNDETGKRYTYRVVDVALTESGKDKGSKEGEVFFVSYLYGPDNSHQFKYVGNIILEDSKFVYRHGKRAKDVEESCPVKGIKWLLGKLQNGGLPAGVSFWHEGKCARCGRTMTDPESIETGFGPTCRAFKTRYSGGGK